METSAFVTFGKSPARQSVKNRVSWIGSGSVRRFVHKVVP
jgi:hypothetical protein